MFRDDPSIFTLSVHNGKNFPLTKQQSDLDVALEDKVGDAEYLKMIVDVLPSVVDLFQPDLVLYDAGVSSFFPLFPYLTYLFFFSFLSFSFFLSFGFFLFFLSYPFLSSRLIPMFSIL